MNQHTTFDGFGVHHASCRINIHARAFRAQKESGATYTQQHPTTTTTT